MLVRFSFYDVIKIPEFSSYSMFDMLNPKMDNLISPFLWKLGADVDKGIRVQAVRHRTIDLKSIVGYSYVCLERSDKEWLANRNCSMSAFIHNQTDEELKSSLIRMSMEGSTEGKFIANCMATYGKEDSPANIRKETCDTMELDISTMLTLREKQKEVRGYLHPDEDMFDGIEDEVLFS